MSEPVILVPLDGTIRARSALPVADSLRRVLGATLRVIHVGGGRQALTELVQRLGLEGAALDGWSIEARTGEAAAATIDEALRTHARFVVMCSHTAEARPAALLSRTALKVLHECPCPVVLVRPGEDLGAWHPKRILIPYDGTPTANAAVGPAAELAASAGSEVVTVQVGSAGIRGPTERGSLMMPRYVDQPQHEWPMWSGELLVRLTGARNAGPLPGRVCIRSGEPGPEIAGLAREELANLIVLAWKGDWGPERAKTLKALVLASPCPIMIVRA